MHRAGLVATIGFGVVAAAKVLTAVFAWLTAAADQYTPLGVAVASVLSSIWLVAFIVAAIAFMLWMRRARRNSEVITPQRHRFTNVWVFVGWFIPIANLYIPYAVMQDIWRASDRAQPTLGLQHREPSGLVLLWWICFLASNFSLTLPAQYGVAIAVFATISALLSVAAAVLGAQVIRRLNAVQVSDQNAFPAPAA